MSHPTWVLKPEPNMGHSGDLRPRSPQRSLQLSILTVHVSSDWKERVATGLCELATTDFIPALVKGFTVYPYIFRSIFCPSLQYLLYILPLLSTLHRAENVNRIAIVVEKKEASNSSMANASIFTSVGEAQVCNCARKDTYLMP